MTKKTMPEGAQSDKDIKTTATAATAETTGPAPAVSKAAVAEAIDADVTVAQTVKNKDKKTGDVSAARAVVARKATADDIVSFRVDGNTVHAVTCDGQRHTGVLG